MKFSIQMCIVLFYLFKNLNKLAVDCYTGSQFSVINGKRNSVALFDFCMKNNTKSALALALQENNCCYLSSNFLKLLKRYYDKTKFVVILDLVNSDWKLSNEIFGYFPDETNLPIIVMRNIRGFREVRYMKINAGIYVVVETADMLSKFIDETFGLHFAHLRGHFVFAILDTAFEDWKVVVENVIKILWENYGILDMIVITPCSTDEFQTIGYYDPFSQSKNLEWGTIQWNRLDYFEFKMAPIMGAMRKLNGYPIKLNIFKRYPTAILETEVPKFLLQSYIYKDITSKSGYAGLDGLVLANLVVALNFTPILLPLSDFIDYGYKLDNGTFTGTLGGVLYHRFDISFNGRFIKYYDTEHIDFMNPVFFDKFCIVAPKSLQIPQWLAIFQCFNSIVWITIIAINIICGCVWYSLKIIAFRYKEREVKDDKVTISNVVIEMWVIMLAGPSIQMPKMSAERIFMTSCLIANLIITGTFQGTLTTSFSTTSYYKDINTLEELDKSGLLIGTSSKSLMDIFGNDSTAVIQSLKEKFKFFNTTTIIRTAYQRDVCCIERQADINVIIKTNYELPDGTILLHVIEHCPRVYYLAYIVRKGWPFLSVFNNVIRRFSEAGLLNKWYKDTEDAIIDHKRLHMVRDEKPLKAFSLVDMQTAFYILGIGLLVCISVFVWEIVSNLKLQI